MLNTYPCYAQHKLANDPKACDKLLVETAKLLTKQDRDTDGLLHEVLAKNEE